MQPGHEIIKDTKLHFAVCLFITVLEHANSEFKNLTILNAEGNIPAPPREFYTFREMTQIIYN